jgi:hypothetical protein
MLPPKLRIPKLVWLTADVHSPCSYSIQAMEWIYGRTPIIRTLVIRIANYPLRFSPSGKSVEDSVKLTCLEIAGYRIK